MSLQKEIERRSQEIHTDGYPMSIGELINLYEDGELDIHPEFQRFYRWDISQKSRLIESFLLGIPVPSIFVYQRKDGVWDVIDGLQRLSTIFEFVGILRDENNKLLPSTQLTKTKYLPSLKGKYWESDNQDTSFDSSQKMFFKRSKLDIKIIKKESDPQSKYELFMRVNTGGAKLSDQEVRNCLLVMENRKFFFWMRELANNPKYIDCVSVSERLIEEQYDLELVLRFLLLKNADIGDVGKQNIGDFLDKKMLELASKKKVPYKKEKHCFEKTFSIIHDELGSDAFRRYTAGKYTGPFLISAFEAIALGVGFQVDEIEKAIANNGYNMQRRVEDLWGDEGFLNGIGSGISATRRMPVTIDIGRKHFRP